MKKIILGLFLLLSVYGRSTPLSKDKFEFNAFEPSQNSPPIIKITAPVDGQKYKYDDWVEVDVDASDVDGKIVSVEVYFEGNLVAFDSVPPYAIAFRSFSIINNGVLKAIATDNTGLTSSDSIMISIAYNVLPQVELVSPHPGQIIKANDTVIFEANATDVDGYITRVDFEVDGNLIGSSSTIPYRAVWKATTGSATIIAKAYDDNYYWHQDTVEILVNQSDFFVKIEKPDNGSVYATGDVIPIEANVHKLPTQQIKHVAFFVNDYLIGVDSVAPYSLNWTAQTGVTLIKAVATSGTVKTEDQVLIYVNDPAHNIPPVVRIVDLYNGYIYSEGNDVSVYTSASDADGTINSVEFFVNGQSIQLDTVAPYTFTWKTVRGRAEIRAIATDNKGTKSKLSNPYNIYVDKKLSGNQIKIIQPVEGSVYKTGDTVLVEVYHTGISASEDYSRYPVSIFVNDARIDRIQDYPNKTQWIATKGKTVIKAISKHYWDEIMDSLTITVEDNKGNIAPVVDIISPYNYSIFDPGKILSIDAHALDGDGTISSVTFFVNGTSIGIDNTLPYSINWTVIADTAKIKVVAKDNTGRETADSTTVLGFQNTAPIIKITAPKDGQVIADGSNIVSIETQTTDDVGEIDQVEFFVNNKSISIDKEYPFNSFWPLVNGEALIKAVATDDKGLKATDSVKIIVNLTRDSTEIKITSPLNGSSYKVGDIITLSADVKPDLYPIDYVQFYIPNSIRLYDSVAPYTVQWPATQAGVTEIHASAVRILTDGSMMSMAYDEVELFIKQADFEVKIKELNSAITLYANNIIDLEAVAHDSKNKVSNVEFFVEGKSVGLDGTFPYTASWLAKKGKAIIVAVATNEIGESVSDTLFIEVEPGYVELEIRSPLNGEEVNEGDEVTIDAYVLTRRIIEEPPFHVEFFVNGISLGVVSKVPAGTPYRVNWIAVKGYALIKAVIWSERSGIALADSVLIKVNTHLLPLVEITTPVNGTIFKPNQQINITAKAMDTDGYIKAVSFFADGILIGTDTLAPYTQTWSTATEGKVSLVAQALDNADLIGISAPVEIIISSVSGISKSDTDHKIVIYPNPTAHVLNIEADENVFVELLSIDGKKLLLQTKVTAQQKHLINIEMIANGSYMVKVYNDKFSSFRKIVINK